MRWLFLICYWVWAYDTYLLDGDFSQVHIYQHEDMVLVKDIAHAVLREQPSVSENSYLVDFSQSDLIISIKQGSYFVVKQVGEQLRICCYDQKDKRGKLKIFIDAGHGGKDSGAISVYGLKEKHVTLSFCKKLKAYLQSPLVDLQFSRQQDIYVDKYDRLQQVLEKKPDLLLSVHADAYTQPHASGVGLFHLDKSHGSQRSRELVAGITHHKCMRDISQELANQMLSRLKGSYKLHADKAKGLPLVVLRSPKSLSILLELGFLSNPEEAALLASENYLDGFAGDMATIIKEELSQTLGIIYSGYLE